MMIVVTVGLVLAMLALATQFGVRRLEREYPPQGRFVDVTDARLHVVEIGPPDTPGLPIVMIPGASSSLETMRQPLGNRLAQHHRVILIDRPGQGWSTRERVEDFTPDIQAKMIGEALDVLGIRRAIFVGHSWGGALVAALALREPSRVTGAVLLSPVLYPWKGGAGKLNTVATRPLIGPLLAYTAILPVGYFLLDRGVDYVFSPQQPPPHYIQATQVPLVLRPPSYLDNAWDLDTLNASVAAQAPRYSQIKMPVVVVAGDADQVASPKLHAKQFAHNVPQTRLIMLPNVGHMSQVAAPDLIAGEIVAMQNMLLAAASQSTSGVLTQP
jgi:pimeloyl-ACP methyl ester carboxylesterase